MDIETAIKELILYISKAYGATKEKVGPNIYRGHLRTLSTDIENGIALFISKILPDCKLFLDSSIHVDGQNNRPDLMVVNEKNETIAMVEIKSNMGWCRNAKKVIDDISENDIKFQKAELLNCEFSMESSQMISYGNQVGLFLIALTDGNCTAKNHQTNKEYAATTKVRQFNLFTGWYSDLHPCEIELFADAILQCNNS